MVAHAKPKPQGQSGNDAEEFVQYYADQSLTPGSRKRLREIRDKVLRVYGAADGQTLDVLDVGCGPGVLSALFAERGHRVMGIDISSSLVRIAEERAKEQQLAIDFRVGSADALPFADASFDVCLSPELLEHVPDWKTCLHELTRVVRPGGVLFLTTTNVLCPVQDEFALPGYSWYPDALKRRCIRLALTTRPQWVRHAEYPAFHWFSFFSLRRELNRLGFRCLDRFDTLDARGSALRKAVTWSVQHVPGCRHLGQMLTPYTQLVAIRAT